MGNKFKIFVWDIDDWGPDFGGHNFQLFWQGNSFFIMLWKLYKAKKEVSTMVRMEWL